MALRYFSTFSGIGGFEVGIHKVMPDAVCVGYSEIDKYASAVYEHRFSGALNYGDITQINQGQLEAFDLFVGGFPCQAFSVAGKRLGFDDTRGTLFFDVARILKAKRPRHLVLENVKGLLSHEGGKTFATILGVLTDLGYFVEWQVLNSKDFGVPQSRERVFIVGHLGSGPRRKVFPITGAFGRTDRHEINQANDPVHSSRRIYTGDGISPTLKARARQDETGPPLLLVRETNQVRRLTPVECERLQGFPDHWTAESVNGAPSEAQRYKMVGNAVTTNVVAAVMERLFNDGH